MPIPLPHVPPGQPFLVLSGPVAVGALDGFEAAVTAATGWLGLGVVFAYSFLIAFALPGPSEVVLAAPLDLGLSYPETLAVIVFVSAVGKALGSVLALALGREVKNSGLVSRVLRNSRFDVIGWSETTLLGLARRYGYGGLAIALCVPFFPDTLSIYAFSTLGGDYARFAVATFLGSLGRLLVTLAVFGGALALV